MQRIEKVRILEGREAFYLMDLSSILRSVQEEPLAPVYTLMNEEHTMAERWLTALRVQLGTDGGLAELERFDYEDEGCENALMSCQSISLFAERSVVVLDQATFLLSNAKVKHDISGLEAYLGNPVPERVLILRVRAEKLDERKKIVKQLKKYPLLPFTTPKDDDALRTLEQVSQEQGHKVARNALQELWRRCQSIARSEVELTKLVTYAGNRQVELNDVVELVSPPLEDNVFTWIDGVVKGNVQDTFRSLADVQTAGYDVFALLSLMVRQFRIMWYARVLGDKGYTQAQVAKEVGAHPYAVKMASVQARSLSPQTMERILLTIADAEYWVKSGKWDANQALEYIVLFSARLIQHRPGKVIP